MKALILAAGYSTRLYPLTRNTPKALLPIGGQAMIDYLAEALRTLPNLTEVVLVTNDRFHPDFERWAEGARARYAPLRFTVLNDGTASEDEKLGAVGDMAFALERMGMDDDVLVAASDNFFTFPLINFVRDFEQSGLDTLLAARIDSLEDLRRFAVATVDEQLRVTSLVEKPKDPPSDIAIYALYLYRKDTLKLIAEYLKDGGSPDAPGYFPEWLHKRKPVKVYLFDGECIDIGTPEAYRAVCERFGGANG